MWFCLSSKKLEYLPLLLCTGITSGWSCECTFTGGLRGEVHWPLGATDPMLILIADFLFGLLDGLLTGGTLVGVGHPLPSSWSQLFRLSFDSKLNWTETVRGSWELKSVMSTPPEKSRGLLLVVDDFLFWFWLLFFKGMGSYVCALTEVKWLYDIKTL